MMWYPHGRTLHLVTDDRLRCAPDAKPDAGAIGITLIEARATGIHLCTRCLTIESLWPTPEPKP